MFMWDMSGPKKKALKRKYLQHLQSVRDAAATERKNKKAAAAKAKLEKLSEPEDETQFKGKVHALLKNISNPGKGGSEFAVCGQLNHVPNVVISVKDGGMMKFPLEEDETQKFIEAFEKSPYGKGTKTIVDPKVRNSWQLDPSGFKILNPKWEMYMKDLIPRIGKEMDIAAPFTASLYKLLLYKTGSFFKVHRDSEKEAGMFGTLVVQLPSKYTGGQLVVSHDSKKKTMDFSSRTKSHNEFEMFFSAFYCDCQHEILPLTSGVRACLIYNLVLAKTEVSIPVAPRMTEIEGQLSSLLKNWENSNGPTKIVYYLTHRYTKQNLSFENLKSSDKTIAKILLNLSKQNDLTLLLGIFEKESSGTSKGDTESDFDSDDEDCWCEKMYSLDNLKLLSTPDKNVLNLKSLSVEYEEEVIPKHCFKNESPYNVKSEDTGNEGVNVSLFYRGAALILFPSENIIQVLISEHEVGTAEKIFLEELEKFRAAGNDTNTDAKIKKWATQLSSKGYVNKETLVPMLSAITSFNDLKLLQTFLDQYKPSNEETFPLILKQCEKFGWSSLSLQLVGMFKMLVHSETRLKVLNLVAAGTLNKEKENVCHLLAEELLKLSVKTEYPSFSFLYNPPTPEKKQKDLEADRKFLYEFCQIAKKINFSVLEYAKTKSAKVVGPVLIQLGKDGTLNSFWFPLKNYCLQMLEGIAVKSIIPTWRFNNYPSCGCKDCVAVNGFIQSEIISMGFKMGKVRRVHIERKLNAIENIQHHSDRIGNQQTLVLTKTSPSTSEEAAEQNFAKELIPKLKALVLVTNA